MRAVRERERDSIALKASVTEDLAATKLVCSVLVDLNVLLGPGNCRFVCEQLATDGFHSTWQSLNIWLMLRVPAWFAQSNNNAVDGAL